MTGNKTEATSWEASVAKTIMTKPRARSPYSDCPSTLEHLEPDMDDGIIDITDYAERPFNNSNDKRSPQHVQKYVTHTVTQGHCPTPRTRSYLLSHGCDSSTCKAPLNGNLGNPPRQKKNTPWMAHLSNKTATRGSL